ncbi:MAG TPA: trehalose-6-phosphate synthase [Ilumatobacteraceae bacterium]|nr:trehalose-6-phosphate synthase [Ilumatobacteraceae bacterium]
MKRLVVVANRLPVEIRSDGQTLVSPGGLVSALSSAIGEGTRWVGWGGPDATCPTTLDHGQLRLHPIVLSTGEVEGYYRGFSNSVLWPLFHGGLRPVHHQRSWWRAYRAVNQRFAATVNISAPLGGTVWVHDYHLLLVPEMIRAKRPDLRVGMFLHIPFPSPRTFAALPNRRELLHGMLSADLLGFQVAEDVGHFVGAVHRLTGTEIGPHGPARGHHRVEVGAFPISIDFAMWDTLGSRAVAQAAEKRRTLGVDSVFLGIDRLDYTKGISQRLLAFSELLDERRLDARSCTFVQVAVPTRSDVGAYRRERDEVERLINRINARHRRADGSVPVLYIDESLDQAALAAWYRAADALVVTSLADGMNLVAKEFVAARGDLGAVLILSEFAGAAHGLTDALIVNPYDVNAIKTAMLTTVVMPTAEKQARLRVMRAAVRNNDVHHWARRFLAHLESATRGGTAMVGPAVRRPEPRPRRAALQPLVIQDHGV